MASKGKTNHTDISRIPVAFLILGWENNRMTLINFFRNAMSSIGFVTDEITPTIGTKLGWLNREIPEARKRGVRFRQISEITSENLQFIKMRMAGIDELRHLPGLKVVFGVSDIEFIALVPSFEPTQEIEKLQFIQSDSESVLRYKRLIFDSLWDRATPAQSRIDELEGKTAIGKESTEAKAPVIDRIYVCLKCNQTFVYKSEVEEHRSITSHQDFSEHPLV
jgi:hypothetical protein